MCAKQLNQSIKILKSKNPSLYKRMENDNSLIKQYRTNTQAITTQNLFYFAPVYLRQDIDTFLKEYNIDYSDKNKIKFYFAYYSDTLIQYLKCFKVTDIFLDGTRAINPTK